MPVKQLFEKGLDTLSEYDTHKMRERERERTGEEKNFRYFMRIKLNSDTNV